MDKTYDVTENKLNRDFQAEKQLQTLVTDIIYLYFGQCKFCLSPIMDLYNLEIVAYTILEFQDTDVVLNTPNQLEHSYTAIKGLSTHPMLTIKHILKKVLTTLCSIKEHHRTMTALNYLHNWRNLTNDSITDIVKYTSYSIMKLEFNRN